MKTEQFDITIDSGYLATYQDTPLEMFKVFREFIDNALQSYLDHKKDLDSFGDSPKKCIVNITWDETEIIIKDNAWGMDHEAFERALKLNKRGPNAEKDQLSKFGIGLKSAACYASKDYIIVSCAYGSGVQYRTEMDIEYIQKNNPKTNPVEVSDCLKDKHGTIITLKKLITSCKFGDKSFKKVVRVLEKIYNHYLQKGILSVSINKRTLSYADPELHREDKLYGWNGNDVYHAIIMDSGFEFEGVTYKYNGWIGMLEKGDSTGETSGLFIYQADRAIVLHYHPSDLFGSNNDYRFQRVTGEIELIGTNWPITINKEQIQWGEGGLQDAFIKSLLRDQETIKVFKTAKDYRARTNEIDVLDAVSTTEKSFSKPTQVKNPESDSEKSQLPGTANTSNSGSPSNSGSALPSVQGDSTTIIASPNGEEEANNQATVTRYYQGKAFQLTITAFNGSPDENWIKLRQSEENKRTNKYEISINAQVPFFKQFSSNAKSRALIVAFAQCFAMARLISVDQGLKMDQSLVLETALNDFVRKTRDE